MRELRAVRVSDDGKEILLAETGDDAQPGSAEAAFMLRADDRLRALLRPRPANAETRPESALSPREIQARLRAGDTAEDVARAAGIPVTRVARYEAPIAAERVRIVDEVRRATAPGPHRVSPGRPLGVIVDERLTEDGYEPAMAQWLARRRPDGTWLVTVDLANNHAEWSWDSGARRVRAHDGGAHRMVSPSRSSAESLIAVAQAAGVTAEAQAAQAAAAPPVAPEPEAPLAPARAVGDSLAPTFEPSQGRSSASSRSGLIVLEGEGVSEEPAPARSQASAAATTLDEVPGASAAPQAPSAPSWGPSAGDVPGSGNSGGSSEKPSHEPSASASDAAEELTDAASEETPARPQAKSKRRSAVPAWDDIVFGARRS